MACDSCISVLLLLSTLLVATMSQSPSCPPSSPPFTTSNRFINIFEDTLISDPDLSASLIDAPFVRGMDPSIPAYEFTGLGSGFAITSMSDMIREASCMYNEVTFSGRVFIRDSQSDGPLLELSYAGGLESGLVVYLLIMDAAADEIVLGYRHQGHLHSETIAPVRLIAGKWRDYTVTLSGNLLTFYFDCQLMVRRVVPLPDYCANDSTVVLNVASSINGGAEYTGSTGLYAYLQDLGIHFGPGALQRQCPAISDECPSCGQFFTLLEKVTVAQERMATLQKRIDELESNVTCPTVAPPTTSTNCFIQEGSQSLVVNDGELLLVSSNRICYCDNGRDVCRTIEDLNVNTRTPNCPDSSSSTLPPNNPSVPTVPPRPACPAAAGLTQPVFVGETVAQPTGNEMCVLYTCVDEGIFGLNLNQRTHNCIDVPMTQNCSDLNSMEKELYQCCRRCDACSFKTCPSNTRCMLEDAPTGAAVCVCKDGFSKNGSDDCIDIDECSLAFRPGGHDCALETSTCVNTQGSFTCSCLSGYAHQPNTRFCEDINECTNGENTCSEHSTCENLPGTYSCHCLSGYMEDDKGVCQPVCEPACVNGGVCISPNICSCLPEFHGHSCEIDVDECEDANPCHKDREECVNTKGGHFCRCIRGFQEVNGTCKDVDECKLRINNCINSAECVNTIGGFLCRCSDTVRGVTSKVDCTGRCIRRGLAYNDGTSRIDKCLNCTCLGGEVSCLRVTCNCSSTFDPDCCPECTQRNCRIMNGTVTIRPGSTWVNPSNRCERYNCLQDQTAVFVDYSARCPTPDCPLALQTTPMGKCCPVCMLRKCDSSLEGRTISIRNGCQRCTCENSSWSCTERMECPAAPCASKDFVFYKNGCCPVCRQQVLGSMNNFCPT